MLQLNNLPTSIKKRKRIGRGGKRGGHSGRGNDGQLCRSGGRSEVKPSFEGGQMPLSRRVPCRGFTNALRKEVCIVNLRDLELRFESGDVVDHQSLADKGLVRGRQNKIVKVLGDGSLTKNLDVKVDFCSAAAEKAIKQTGGRVNLIGEINSGGTAS